jgi:alkylhydroperoxidase/carboxymuconolactone decarboxylase family protein YurZ
MRARQVNPQLKGHLRGALNGGASVEQVRAVRQVSIQVCRASGMRLLTADDPPDRWGWRAEVQDL